MMGMLMHDCQMRDAIYHSCSIAAVAASSHYAAVTQSIHKPGVVGKLAIASKPLA